ncbi:MAG: cold shock domain-containing protein [Elusimicrobiota bacterium]
MRGKVKWFSERKGYGFISKDDGSGDVFVHFQAIEGDGYKTLREGEDVEFNVTNSPKGEKAENVKRISTP